MKLKATHFKLSSKRRTTTKNKKVNKTRNPMGFMGHNSKKQCMHYCIVLEERNGRKCILRNNS